MYELIWNQTEFRSVSNQNWNFQYEQIPFNSKENENLLGWVYNAGKQVFMRRGRTGIVKVTRKPQADWERRKKNKNKNDYIHTQKNIFEILLNQTEIRLYLPCTDWFGTKLTSGWFHINRKMVNIIDLVLIY